MRNGLAYTLLVLAACSQSDSDDEVTTKYLETVPSVSPDDLSPSFRAIGTEPFWAIEVTKGQMKYSSPENLQGTHIPANLIRDDNAWQFMGSMDGKRVILQIEPGPCSDGMSDKSYDFKAKFTWGERSELGCAVRNQDV
jgi:uncharacterized membrane protein